MGFITTALVGLAAGAAAIGSVKAAKDQRKDAQASMRTNETAAREAARLNKTKLDAGADIVLGAEGEDMENTKDKRRVTQRRPVGPPSLGTSLGGSVGTEVGLR
jgi:hypothetical protein